MPRISVLLNRDEAQALIQLALSDLREPNVEARFLLRQELIRRGMLKDTVASAREELPTTNSASTPNQPAQDVVAASEGK
jgi:hypothetical protein